MLNSPRESEGSTRREFFGRAALFGATAFAALAGPVACASGEGKQLAGSDAGSQDVATDASTDARTLDAAASSDSFADLEEEDSLIEQGIVGVEHSDTPLDAASISLDANMTLEQVRAMILAVLEQIEDAAANGALVFFDESDGASFVFPPNNADEQTSFYESYGLADPKAFWDDKLHGFADENKKTLVGLRRRGAEGNLHEVQVVFRTFESPNIDDGLYLKGFKSNPVYVAFTIGQANSGKGAYYVRVERGKTQFGEETYTLDAEQAYVSLLGSKGPCEGFVYPSGVVQAEASMPAEDCGSFMSDVHTRLLAAANFEKTL